jgi:hypothetical protein
VAKLLIFTGDASPEVDVSRMRICVNQELRASRRYETSWGKRESLDGRRTTILPINGPY